MIFKRQQREKSRRRKNFYKTKGVGKQKEKIKNGNSKLKQRGRNNI